jgi:hypothetical protein
LVVAWIVRVTLVRLQVGVRWRRWQLGHGQSQQGQRRSRRQCVGLCSWSATMANVSSTESALGGVRRLKLLRRRRQARKRRWQQRAFRQRHLERDWRCNHCSKGLLRLQRQRRGPCTRVQWRRRSDAIQTLSSTDTFDNELKNAARRDGRCAMWR